MTVLVVYGVLHTLCITALYKFCHRRKFDIVDKILIIIAYIVLSIVLHAVLLASWWSNAVSNVYHSPMLSTSECDGIVAIAEQAASHRGGWEKTRHRSYPTTDICAFDIEGNITIDGKSQHFVTYINSTLSTRIYPLISSHYDIPVHQLSARDLFIVKYDAEAAEGQRRLREHQDHSEISFNIALSRSDIDFSGGGTRFVISNTVINIEKGSILLHESGLFHAGYPIQSGVRYILVGFINVAPQQWHDLKYYGTLAHCVRIHDDSGGEYCRSWFWMIRYLLTKAAHDIWSSTKESDRTVKYVLIFLMGVVVVLLVLLLCLCVFWKDDDGIDVDLCENSSIVLDRYFRGKNENKIK